jgi:hypothetical protein
MSVFQDFAPLSMLYGAHVVIAFDLKSFRFFPFESSK